MDVYAENLCRQLSQLYTRCLTKAAAMQDKLCFICCKGLYKLFACKNTNLMGALIDKYKNMTGYYGYSPARRERVTEIPEALLHKL